MWCEIRVRGSLSPDWADWFETLNLVQEPDGNTRLTGLLPDQAALFGLLNRLYGLNRRILSLVCVDDSPPASSFGE
jgi:hypothetical protein